MSRLLLDTCALIWLGNGRGELTDAALTAIADVDELYVSPVSLWEISNKCRLGKLNLELPVREWFLRLTERLSIQMLQLTVEDMISAGELPEHHKDPADRMIIASALREKLTVVTGDRNFPKYGVITMQ